MTLSAYTAMNAVCPYYTMFPLQFPLRVLKNGAKRGDWVLDPFCGRGTTNFAARLVGLPAVGLDSSPVAVAIARAKYPRTTVAQVVQTATQILETARDDDVPTGAFWRWAFHAETLGEICRLRRGLLDDHRSAARVVLRAITLGAMHGPTNKGEASYFSNQCPRTFAPKPRYATKFWRERKLRPKRVDVLRVIARRAEWYLGEQTDAGEGGAYRGDSREKKAFAGLPRFSWVITSPPYYGMRTYLQDQWLRHWFLGGPEEVEYQNARSQLTHEGPDEYTKQLRAVWLNAARSCHPGARLVCRFGGIRDRVATPMELIRESLTDSGWRVTTIHAAGSPLDGKRQADQFRGASDSPHIEYDIYARRI